MLVQEIGESTLRTKDPIGQKDNLGNPNLNTDHLQTKIPYQIVKTLSYCLILLFNIKWGISRRRALPRWRGNFKTLPLYFLKLSIWQKISLLKNTIFRFEASCREGLLHALLFLQRCCVARKTGFGGGGRKSAHPVSRLKF